MLSLHYEQSRQTFLHIWKNNTGLQKNLNSKNNRQTKTTQWAINAPPQIMETAPEMLRNECIPCALLSHNNSIASPQTLVSISKGAGGGQIPCQRLFREESLAAGLAAATRRFTTVQLT